MADTLIKSSAPDETEGDGALHFPEDAEPWLRSSLSGIFSDLRKTQKKLNAKEKEISDAVLQANSAHQIAVYGIVAVIIAFIALLVATVVAYTQISYDRYQVQVDILEKLSNISVSGKGE